MRVLYVGPHDGVEVYDGGSVVVAERDGPPVEITDDVALSLLEQRDNWSMAPGAPATKATVAKAD